MMIAAGVPVIRMHDLRRTFSSQMNEVADIKVIQALLGHVKLETTDKYIELLPGKLEQSTESLVSRSKDHLWMDEALRKSEDERDIARQGSGADPLRKGASGPPSKAVCDDGADVPSNVLVFDAMRRRRTP